MDHLHTEEQRKFRQTVREFAETEIRPTVAERDRSSQFAADIIKKLGKLGWLGVNTPPHFGGAGKDAISYSIVIEELSRVDPSIGVVASVNNSMICYPLEKFGSPDQQKQWLIPAASGEIIGAFCLTEPEAGSDAANQQTFAQREGDCYIINGTKNFITNGKTAAVYIVFAQTDHAKGAKGITAFIIPSSAEGVRTGVKEKKMGIRSSDCCSVILEDVKVPISDRLGEEGDGFKVAMSALDSGRIGIASQAVGLAQGAMEEAVKYAQERKQFNKQLADFQAIQFKLADMELQIQAARLLVYSAARKKDLGLKYNHDAAMCKLFASDIVMKVAQEAVQIHGANGYSTAYPVERMLRDAKVTEIYEGTSEIQRAIIARNLLNTRF